MNASSWLRVATMASCVVIVIVAGCVAAAAVNGNNKRWWATLGCLAVAGAMVYVAYVLFRSGYYLSFDPQ